jgi:hypothetical protein
MRKRVDMDTIIGFTLQIGVTLSLALIGIGLVWHRFKWETWQWPPDYTLPATTVFGFLVTDVEQATGEPPRPRMLVNLGIAVLRCSTSSSSSGTGSTPSSPRSCWRC